MYNFTFLKWRAGGGHAHGHGHFSASAFHLLQTVPQLTLPYFCTGIFFCFVIE
ncbi:hypothetical protein HMPREF0373_00526 [Eubacterium ramulus ATCC 29099]|uniref:Uncharacterized protein n=1 Tax=Eubacterium ramulus ATCC 29099 TaxID=1256908 RepID=U2RB54_EUBRA|nr:hypothetical protein HMPREF0373_00526 [Eubacterium ramulus ATCC 29099]